VSVEVFVPANFVAAGWGTPTVCARHGEPAVVSKRIRFVSHTSAWLILLGVLIYFVVVAATRKSVWSPAWPFCTRCEKERTTKLAAGWGSLLAGAALWVASTQLLPRGAAPIGALIGLVLFVGGAMVAGRGGRYAIAGGVVTDDGRAVRFPRAHETFATQATTAQQAAAHHYAAQPAPGHTQPN
jgi:hypothetical protein